MTPANDQTLILALELVLGLDRSISHLTQDRFDHLVPFSDSTAFAFLSIVVLLLSLLPGQSGDSLHASELAHVITDFCDQCRCTHFADSG